METTFYQFGAEYLRWTNEKGQVFEAVKEQVEWFGKECFEQDLEDYVEENDIPEPDGITFNPDWWLKDGDTNNDWDSLVKWCNEQGMC